jgi:hypothetical protein
MRKIALVGLGLFVSIFCLLGQIVIYDLDESKAFNLGQLLENNNVIIIHPIDIDKEGDNLFILDLRLCHILKVDIKTGTLLKLISSRGQGPSELGLPTSMRVKDKLIYVCDRAYGGIKIFDANEGRLIKAIKVSASLDDLDVFKNGHIVLKKVDLATNSLVSEYDEGGKWIRDIVRSDITTIKEKGEKYFAETFVRFHLDAQECLILLYPLKRIVAKYDKGGQLLWERKVENEILRKSITAEDSISISGSGAVSYTLNIFDLTTDQDENIIVGHNGGGQIFTADGDTVALIQGKNLRAFLISENRIVSVLPQGYAHIFNLNILRRQ